MKGQAFHNVLFMATVYIASMFRDCLRAALIEAFYHRDLQVLRNDVRLQKIQDRDQADGKEGSVEEGRCIGTSDTDLKFDRTEPG